MEDRIMEIFEETKGVVLDSVNNGMLLAPCFGMVKADDSKAMVINLPPEMLKGRHAKEMMVTIMKGAIDIMKPDALMIFITARVGMLKMPDGAKTVHDLQEYTKKIIDKHKGVDNVPDSVDVMLCHVETETERHIEMYERVGNSKPYLFKKMNTPDGRVEMSGLFDNLLYKDPLFRTHNN